jgi:hypothetical protein
MANTQDKTDQELVKVTCIHSVQSGKTKYKPGGVAELPLDEVERLENGGHVERLFDIPTDSAAPTSKASDAKTNAPATSDAKTNV